MKKMLATCLVLMIAGLGGSVQAGTLNVGAGQDYLTIQSAVDFAVDGDVIKVQVGTYPEQVEIRGLNDLSLEGDMATITVPDDGMTGSLVKIVNCQNFQFTGFTLDGNNGEGVEPGSANSSGESDTRFYGLFAINSSGQIIANSFKDISWGNGSQQGVGAYVYVDDGIARDIDIFENTVTNFQKAGLAVSGPIKSKISKNTITHWGETGIIAANGIQVHGGKGLIIGNIVSDSQYYDDEHVNWYASGILIMAYLESVDNYRVVRNSLSSSDVGIAIVDYGAGITDITIVNNTFAGNLWDTEYSQDGKIGIIEHASKYE